MWKQIEETPFYINECGEVKSVDRYVDSHKGGTPYKRFQRGRLHKGGQTVNGYEFVPINGKHHFRHRLVLEAFKPNPNPEIYTDVNHIDENPHNNRLDNLEWCTHKYNCNYGRRKTGNQDKAKMVSQYDLDGNLVRTYKSVSEAERENNVPIGGGIGRCCRGTQKKYINHIWKYEG